MSKCQVVNSIARASQSFFALRNTWVWFPFHVCMLAPSLLGGCIRSVDVPISFFAINHLDKTAPMRSDKRNQQKIIGRMVTCLSQGLLLFRALCIPLILPRTTLSHLRMPLDSIPTPLASYGYRTKATLGVGSSTEPHYSWCIVGTNTGPTGIIHPPNLPGQARGDGENGTGACTA